MQITQLMQCKLLNFEHFEQNWTNGVLFASAREFSASSRWNLARKAQSARPELVLGTGNEKFATVRISEFNQASNIWRSEVELNRENARRLSRVRDVYRTFSQRLYFHLSVISFDLNSLLYVEYVKYIFSANIYNRLKNKNVKQFFSWLWK